MFELRRLGWLRVTTLLEFQDLTPTTPFRPVEEEVDLVKVSLTKPVEGQSVPGGHVLFTLKCVCVGINSSTVRYVFKVRMLSD